MKTWDEAYEANKAFLIANGCKLERMDLAFVVGELTARDMKIQVLESIRESDKNFHLEMMQVGE